MIASHVRRSLRLGWMAALALAVACGGGGGGGGGGTTPVAPELDLDFALRYDFEVGLGFHSDSLIEDLDQDGLLDLVETNFYGSRLIIALGTNDEEFITSYRLETLGAPWKLASGDFGGDGLTDIAVISFDDQGAFPNGIDLFEQGPLPGEFGLRHTQVVLPYKPVDLAVMDASGLRDGPGLDLLLVADRDGQRVEFLEFDGVGGVITRASLDSSSLGQAGRPFTLAVVDFDGDLDADLLVGEIDVPGGAPDRVVSYRRDGPAFEEPELLLAPLFSPLLQQGFDVNGDGFEDLGVTQLDNARAYVLVGGAQGWAQALPVDFEAGASALAFGDVNDDGLTDVLAAVKDHDALHVRLASAPLVWREPQRYNLGSEPRGIHLADLQGNGDLDLVSTNARDFSVLTGSSSGVFRAARGFPILFAGPVSLDTGDLDGDGDLDACVLTSIEPALIFLQNDGGELSPRSVVVLEADPDENFGQVRIADLDGDGKNEVVATVNQADEVRIFRNPGPISSFTAASAGDVVSAGIRPTGLDLADFNGDGQLDIVVGNAGDLTVQILEGDGSGGFVARAPVGVGGRPGFIQCADLDQDGFADVALTVGGGGTERGLVLLRNDGSGELTVGYGFPIDAVSASMTIGDFDGNSYPDIVVGQPNVKFDEVFLTLNLGEFNFSTEAVKIGVNPGIVIAADADRDEHLDLLIPSGSSDLQIVLGDGRGSLGSSVTAKGELPMPHLAVDASYADMNGDGLTDLVLVSTGTPMIWVAWNVSAPAR